MSNLNYHSKNSKRKITKPIYVRSVSIAEYAGVFCIQH